MSTRASILVKENNESCYIYHHHDGYVEGVGQTLINFLQKLPNWSWFMEDIVNQLIKMEDKEFEYTTCIHGDEEYFYTIDCKTKQLSYVTDLNQDPIVLYEKNKN